MRYIGWQERHDPQPDIEMLGQFFGPHSNSIEPWHTKTYPTMQEAVDAFNAALAAFCAGLPEDAILLWRRPAAVEMQTDFETDNDHWQCTCRITAYRDGK